MTFRKTWNNDGTGMATPPVSDNAAFAAPTSTPAPKTTGRYGPTLNDLQAMDQKQLTPIKPMSRRRSFVWKGRLLFWGIAAILGLISTSWKQIEKFAPGLNKTIHSSVTNQDDVDYHAAKMAEARTQYDRATTKAPGQSLEEYRKQVVTQGQPPLKAMEYETTELQQALPHEHMTPECAPLVTDVFIKLQAYYRAEETIMQAVRDGDETAMNAAVQLEHTAVNNDKAAQDAVAAHPACKGY